jgi:hypothetical protein
MKRHAQVNANDRDNKRKPDGVSCNWSHAKCQPGIYSSTILNAARNSASELPPIQT